MTRSMTRTLIVLLGLGAMLLMSTSGAFAGPRVPPNFGVQNPQGLEHCWHPDPVKCFTTGWADGKEVHIVADPIEVVGTTDERGIVTFWCQSNIGFKYQLWLSELEPMSTYSVTTVGDFVTTLGTFRTDPAGYGALNGILKLDPGEYYVMLQVRDDVGAVVYDTVTDGQGFVVF